MSLFIFGKLIPYGPFDSRIFCRDHPLIRPDSIDPEDVEVLESQEALSGDGFYFAITSGPSDIDATQLWNDSQTSVPSHQGVAETALGAAVHRLLNDRRLQKGGIAFVDGGVEEVFEGTSAQCWKWFEERISKPWDAVDNPLLIWS